MNSAYIASVINSTLRSTTPILLAALGCAMCSRVGVFNVALEAQMLIACFTSIAVNYFTSSVLREARPPPVFPQTSALTSPARSRAAAAPWWAPWWLCCR